MSSQDIVIQTNGLSKSYKGVDALRSLDLSVTKNRIYGFLGPNGAGKTTTIKLLLGLTRPTAGNATLFGYDIAHNSIDIRKRVGYLAQSPTFYSHLSARETLRFVAKFFYTGPKDALNDRINEVLELVGLSSKADRPIKGFSGGEMQRLGIAQAQINTPDLLILDEPAANLDPMGRRDVLEVMDKLRDYSTIFYSTHILDDVQRVSDHVAILNHGRLVAEGAIEDILAGGGNTTYSLKVKGNVDSARETLSNIPWVAGVTPVSQNGSTTFEVSVTDQALAEQDLLRTVLAKDDLVVQGFNLKQANLEEVFFSIVEEDNHGK